MCKKLHCSNLGVVFWAIPEGKREKQRFWEGGRVAAMLSWRAVPQPLAAAGAWHGGGSLVEDMDARAVATVSVLVTQRVAA